jgi:hypothetical protein
MLFVLIGGVPVAEARDFTIGVKAWNASLSSDNPIVGDEDFIPGLYLSLSLSNNWAISTGYVEGTVDFLTATGAQGSIEEVDSEFIVRRRLTKWLEVGGGYRLAKFTTEVPEADVNIETKSSGPAIYLGGGTRFGQSRHWGYYFGVAFMFEDFDDGDGSQQHFNGEGGIQWASKHFSILVGYRHKEYTGDGGGFTFSGPVANFAYTF